MVCRIPAWHVIIGGCYGCRLASNVSARPLPARHGSRRDGFAGCWLPTALEPNPVSSSCRAAPLAGRRLLRCHGPSSTCAARLGAPCCAARAVAPAAPALCPDRVAKSSALPSTARSSSTGRAAHSLEQPAEQRTPWSNQCQRSRPQRSAAGHSTAQRSAAHLGGGGDDVRLVHAAHGHAVELEGAGHQQQAGGQLQRGSSAWCGGGSGGQL